MGFNLSWASTAGGLHPVMGFRRIQYIPVGWLRRANSGKVGPTLALVPYLCKNSAQKTQYINPFFTKTAKSCDRCHSFSRWLVCTDAAFAGVALTLLAFVCCTNRVILLASDTGTTFARYKCRFSGTSWEQGFGGLNARLVQFH